MRWKIKQHTHTSYLTRIRQGGAASCIGYISDTDTWWIRIGRVSEFLLISWILSTSTDTYLPIRYGPAQQTRVHSLYPQCQAPTPTLPHFVPPPANMRGDVLSCSPAVGRWQRVSAPARQRRAPPALTGDELHPYSPAAGKVSALQLGSRCPATCRPPIPWVHTLPYSRSTIFLQFMTYCCLISLVRTSSSSVHSRSTLFLHFLISCCLIFFVCSGWCLACLQIWVDGVSFFHSRSTLQLAVLDEWNNWGNRELMRGWMPFINSKT